MFGTNDGVVICTKCDGVAEMNSEKAASIICAGCGQPLGSSAMIRNHLNEWFHENCFTCDHCSKVLDNDNFIVEEGKKLHAECCLRRELSDADYFCVCGQLLMGDCVAAENKHFHRQCFKCTDCSNVLNATHGYLAFGDGEVLLCPSCYNRTPGNSTAGGSLRSTASSIKSSVSAVSAASAFSAGSFTQLMPVRSGPTFCKACGFKVETSSRFCGSCGHKTS